MPKREIKIMEPREAVDAALAFTCPTISYGKSTILTFYAFDPDEGRLRRKRVRLDRLGPVGFIRRRERQICARFTALLAQGWSPFRDATPALSDTPRRPAASAITLSEAVDRHNAYVAAEVARKVMSEATAKTYLSYSRRFLSEVRPGILASSVDTPALSSFVDGLKASGASVKYCNCIVGWLKTLFGWLAERGVVAGNVASPLKTETTARIQGRETMTDDERLELFRRLRESGRKEFLLACMMEYYTLIRPNELYRVKVKYIDLEGQTVLVPAEISKNRKSARVALPTVVADLMKELGIDRRDGDCYLFGDRLKCCRKLGTAKQFGRYWDNHVVCKGGVYPELGRRRIVFYSLKNSGITAMLSAGVPSMTVKDQARHQDISTTEIYARHDTLKAPEGLREYS